VAEQRHYGRRYRTLTAQHERTKKESDFLAAEVMRTFNWIEERVAAAEQRLASLGSLAEQGRELLTNAIEGGGG